MRLHVSFRWSEGPISITFSFRYVSNSRRSTVTRGDASECKFLPRNALSGAFGDASTDRVISLRQRPFQNSFSLWRVSDSRHSTLINYGLSECKSSRRSAPNGAWPIASTGTSATVGLRAKSRVMAPTRSFQNRVVKWHRDEGYSLPPVCRAFAPLES